MSKKKKKHKKRNLIAKELQHPIFHPKTIPNKKKKFKESPKRDDYDTT